jgi:hypothetical protein
MLAAMNAQESSATKMRVFSATTTQMVRCNDASATTEVSEDRVC